MPSSRPTRKRSRNISTASPASTRNGRAPPAATLADHIDHAVKLIGIDHVGIASDFQGGGGIEGWSHAGETQNVTMELLDRGYSEEEIAKLWGGNLLRVMEAAESEAD